jgi:hypothetical protein
MKNQHIILATLLLATTAAFSQEVRVGLNTSIGKYNHSTADMPFTYYPNVGLDIAYVQKLTGKSSVSVGVRNLTHSYTTDFPQTPNTEVEVYGSVRTWEIPINFIQEFTTKGTYIIGGVGFSTSRTSVPGRLRSSTNENSASISQSISYTRLDKSAFNVVPQLGLGQKFKIGRNVFFAELSASYYSRIPDVTILYSLNSDRYMFNPPESAMVYRLQIGYVLGGRK